MQLSARNIQVEAGSKKILDSVNFAARAGELVGILGPSGAGKSTLMMAVSGFRPASDGRVTFDGRDLYEDFESIKQRIGFVPQDDLVPRNLRVEQVLRYAAELRLPQLSKQERERRVTRLLRQLDLHERADLRVKKLSGGQRKRVNVAVELLAEPDLLFADEPTSGLDPLLEASMMEMFKDMADQGRVVVLTTHVMASLNKLDIVCLLVEGRLVYFAPPAELKDYFEVDDFIAVYETLAARPAQAWEQAFKASPLYEKHLRTRLV